MAAPWPGHSRFFTTMLRGAITPGFAPRSVSSAPRRRGSCQPRARSATRCGGFGPASSMEASNPCARRQQPVVRAACRRRCTACRLFAAHVDRSRYAVTAQPSSAAYEAPGPRRCGKPAAGRDAATAHVTNHPGSIQVCLRSGQTRSITEARVRSRRRRCSSWSGRQLFGGTPPGAP